MISIAVCDDEPELRKILKKELAIKLDLQGLIYTIEEIGSGEELLETKTTYDLIFLDIEMQGINGMDTARELRQRECKSMIVFVTAHSDYVFEGYEVQSLHYIMKPFQGNKIARVLDLCLDAVKAHRDAFFHFQVNNQNHRVAFRDILYFISDRRKVTVCLEKESFSFYGRLDDVEKVIGNRFVRIHQRYIVCLANVQSIGVDQCNLGELTLPVSRKHSQQLAIAFAKYMVE